MTEPKNVLRARLYRRTTLESVSGLARRGHTIAFNLFVPSGFNSEIPRVSYKWITNDNRSRDPLINGYRNHEVSQS